MLDYPYPTNYGISLPGWPVNETCRILLENLDQVGIVRAFAMSMGVFYNNTGNWTCYNISTDIPNWGGCCGWDYLACTEIYLPSGSGNRGMFPYSPWNLTADEESCYQQFGVEMRPYWGIVEFGGFNITAGSYILFSNGLLDPWHSSGVLTNLSDTLLAVVISESAHHFDLRGPNNLDPLSVTLARQQEASIIEEWLVDWWVQNK